MLASRLIFPVQPVHVVLVIIRALAVHGLLIVAAATSEVRGRRMIRSGQRAVRNAVAIDISVALETSELLQFFDREHLAAIELLPGIVERIRHPVIHTQIEIAYHEYRRLESLGKIKRL